jgi:Secretion system C-terminal sorting domain/PKD domain/Periplasmic copper-binding protein (NosD)
LFSKKGIACAFFNKSKSVFKSLFFNQFYALHMKKLFFLAFLFILSIQIYAQKQITPTCGIYTKSALEFNQSYPYYDRFGNRFTQAEVNINGLKGASTGECLSGYFKLVLDTKFTDDEKLVFCTVFQELSDLIVPPQPIIKGREIPIYIYIDSDPFFTGLGVNYAAASPLYDGVCGIQKPVALTDILSGGANNPDNYIGYIRINGDIRKNNGFHLDLKSAPSKGSNKTDFYSVVLHEALHVLGFSSLIGIKGNPIVDNAYSNWDLLLYSEKLQKNLISPQTAASTCCNEHMITTGISAPNDYDDCTDKIKLLGSSVYVGNQDSPTSNYTVNMLSHLYNNNCDSGKYNVNKYVMFHNGGFETKDYLTKSEIQILCNLGYPIKSTVLACNKPSPCILIANDDGPFTTNTGKNLTIPFSTLLSNDIIPNGANIVPSLVKGYSAKLTINSSATSFDINISSPGTYTFQYQIKGCNNQCDIATITVIYTTKVLNINCVAQNCEYLCYGDFEAFLPNNGVNSNNYFSNPNGNFSLEAYKLAGYTYNTISVKPYSPPPNSIQIANQYLSGSISKDGYSSFYIQLNKPILPNQEIAVSFKGLSDKFNTKMQLLALVGSFCGSSVTNIAIPPTSCTNSVVDLCGNQTLKAYCMGEVNLFYQQPGNLNLIQNPIFNSTHELNLVWKNTTGTSIDRIMFYPYNNTYVFPVVQTTTSNLEYVIDDISVKSSTNQNAITVKQELILPFIAGGNAKIKYTVYANNLSSGSTLVSDLSLKAIINPNNNAFGIIKNTDFTNAGIATFSIKSGETKVLFLEIAVAPTFGLSSYSGIISLSVESTTNSCISNFSKLCETTILGDMNNGFSSQDIDICQRKVQFNSTLQDPSLKHFWDFGDGTTSTLANPLHQYATIGIYNVIHQINGLPINPKPISVLVGGKYAIGAAGKTTLLTNSALASTTAINNELIFIDGTLTINKDYKFTNCTFLMQAASKIEIGSGVDVTIDNSKFSTCGDQMWQGIEVLEPVTIPNSNTFNLTKSTIEDAHYAINLKNNVTSQIINNTFSKNYINIFSENSDLSNLVIYNNNHNSYNTTLKNPYKGQPIPSKWYDTYAAYCLKNVSFIVIGFNSNSIAEQINGTKNGIIIENGGQVLTYYVSFKNIQPNSNNSASGLLQGFAINSTATKAGASLTVLGLKSKTLFENCLVGISANGHLNSEIDLVVQDNIMESVRTAISGTFLSKGSAQSNRITNTYGGIRINNSGNFYIYDNEIYVIDNPEPTAITEYGIWLDKCDGNSSLTLSAEKNIIETDKVPYGVRLSDTKGALIRNQDITIKNGRLDGFTDGINVVNSQESVIMGNVIKGQQPKSNDPPNPNDPLETPETVGIFMHTTSDNLFCCNNVDYLYTGVEVRSTNNSDNQFIGTRFNTHNTSLWLRKARTNSVDPLIGVQGHTGNRWKPFSAVEEAINESKVSSSIDKFPFLIEVAQGQYPLFPKFISTPNIKGVSWFQKANGVSNECVQGSDACLQMKPSSDLSSIDRFLLNSAGTKDLHPIATWQLSRDLYSKLSKNPSLLKEDEVQSFYENTKNTLIPTFVGIAESFAYLKKNQTAEQSNLENNIATKRARLVKIKKQLIEGGKDNSLISESAVLSKELNTMLQLLNGIVTKTKKENHDALLSLKERNESLYSDFIIEQNMIKVNQVRINQLLSDTNILTDEDLSVLVEVAYQCEVEGGEAVQTARAMLSWYDGNKYGFGRDTKCTEAFLSKQQKNNFLTEVTIYPNPTSSSLNISKTASIFIDAVEIYDILGRNVLSQEINDDLTILDISTLKAGIYVCKLLRGGKYYTALPFSVIK